MALSNKFGWLVLATGNKSEMSVGYTTLYGDLAGGFAVIKDVPKTLVYRLCAWRNSPAGPGAARRRSVRSRRRREPDPGLDHRARALRRATPRPARRGLAAAVRAARPHPQGYVELDQSREQLIAQGLPAGGRRPHDPPGRPRRVQAPPGPSGDQDHSARVRARPPHADHQPLPGLAAGARCSVSEGASLRCGRRRLICARASRRRVTRRRLCACARRVRRHRAGPARSRTTCSRG